MEEYISFDSHKRYTLMEREQKSAGQGVQRRIEHRPGAICRSLKGIARGTVVAMEATGNWSWIVNEIEQAGHLGAPDAAEESYSCGDQPTRAGRAAMQRSVWPARTRSSPLPVRDPVQPHYLQPEWDQIPPSYMRGCCCLPEVTARMVRFQSTFALWLTHFRPQNAYLVTGYYAVDPGSYEDVKGRFERCNSVEAKKCHKLRQCFSFAAKTNAMGKYLVHFVKPDQAFVMTLAWWNEHFPKEGHRMGLNPRWMKWAYIKPELCRTIITRLNIGDFALPDYLSEEKRLRKLS